MTNSKSVSRTEIISNLVDSVSSRIDFETNFTSDMGFQTEREGDYSIGVEKHQFLEEYRRGLERYAFQGYDGRLFWLYKAFRKWDAGIDNMFKLFRRSNGVIEINKVDKKSKLSKLYGADDFNIMYKEMCDYFFDTLELVGFHVVARTSVDIDGVDDLLHCCNQLLIICLCDYLGLDINKRFHDEMIGSESQEYFFRSEIERKMAEIID